MMGVAVGETMMFAFYGMMGHMLFTGVLALLINAGLNVYEKSKTNGLQPK